MDLGGYLGECRRVLRPDGWLLLSTHGTWLYHPHPTDFRRWTEAGLVGELEAHGFNVERITGLIGPLAWTTLFRLLGYREALRRIPLLGAFVLPVLTTLMNLRMELEDAVTPASMRQTNACIYVVVARSPCGCHRSGHAQRATVDGVPGRSDWDSLHSDELERTARSWSSLFTAGCCPPCSSAGRSPNHLEVYMGGGFPPSHRAPPTP